MLRQFSGFAASTLLPFTTYRVEPSGLMLTELGYQPVGIRPVTTGCFPVRLMTATALVPPSVTYAVRSSGERATLLGLLPLGTVCPLPSTPAGALALTWPTTWFVAVLIMINSSEFAATTNSSVWAAFRVILSGLPATRIRVLRERTPPAKFSTSRSEEHT